MKLRTLCILGLLIAPVMKAATVPFCTVAGVPVMVRAEGLTERTGDILLYCNGSAPGVPVTSNLMVYLMTGITNRLSADGMVDATLAFDGGSGPVTLAPRAHLDTPYSISFNGFTVMPPASGSFSLRISGIRVAASNFPAYTPINAYLATQFPLQTNTVTVGMPQPSLLSTQSQSLVGCYGSPVPEPLTMVNLFAVSAQATTRITEALPSALEKRDPATMDTGVRVMLKFSGFPGKARLFVPNLVAGSTALQPTIGGDLGGTPNPGLYAPSSAGTMLLARVTGADATGAGGTVPPAPTATVTLNGAGEVTLTDGAGYAVFEVLDSNPTVNEWAQIPVFMGLQPITDGNFNFDPKIEVSYAPVSTLAMAAVDTTVPRFVATAPASDCTALNDCDAGFRPQLQVSTDPLTMTAQSGSGVEIRWLEIVNTTSPNSLMPWTATIHYENGAGWIRMDPMSATNSVSARVDLNPANLAPGTYKATILIDAGAAGQRTVPVEITVTAAIPTITGYGNAASGKGPLVAGSLAQLTGSMFGGGTAMVDFDGQPALVVSSSPTQLTVVVPATLSGKSTSQVVVTVYGSSGPAKTVKLAAVAPAVFDGGVLNEDGSRNTEANPEPPGGLLLVRATGLPLTGPITARIGDRDILAPPYAGPADGLPGVQQVNVPVPGDFGGGATVILCAPDPATGQSVCTEPALLYVTLK